MNEEFTGNIFLGLGANTGNRLMFLKTAVQMLEEDPYTRIVKVSSVYESEPYGLKEQDNFLNAVVMIATRRDLFELHKWIKDLEVRIGRHEGPRWGPREIDIDLLFYNDVTYSDVRLTVPHKEVLLRDFVLIPLKEISGEFVHPGEGVRIADIETGKIEKLIFATHKTALSDRSGENIDGV
ncbi:MAG: 2-amino-4-hydroxy-6-hydroxymethyldihydropteridine diphosphokinase [Bacteroidota bacterium]